MLAASQMSSDQKGIGFLHVQLLGMRHVQAAPEELDRPFVRAHRCVRHAHVEQVERIIWLLPQLLFEDPQVEL